MHIDTLTPCAEPYCEHLAVTTRPVGSHGDRLPVCGSHYVLARANDGRPVHVGASV